MKKELKGFFIGTVVTALTMACMPSFAQSVAKSINVSFNPNKIIYNGKALTGDNFVYNGSTYAELRGICTAFGKDVTWDRKTSTVIIKDKVPQDTQPKDTKLQNSNEPNASPVPNESIKPEIADVKAVSGTEVEVIFSEKVSKGSAESTSNYSIIPKYGEKDSLPISKAALDSSGIKVTLTTAGQKILLYNIDMKGVSDLAGNTMDAVQKVFVGMKSENPYEPDHPGTAFEIKNINVIDSTSISITTNMKLDKASAENIANYTIHETYGTKESLKISSAELSSNGTDVTLKTESQKSGVLYTIDTKGIKDVNGTELNDASNKFVGKSEKTLQAEAAVSLSNTSVQIYFNMKMDSSIEDAGVYKIYKQDGDKAELKVLKAELDSTKTKVTLTTEEQKSGVYEIKISSAKSIYGDTMTDSAIQFAGTAK